MNCSYLQRKKKHGSRSSINRYSDGDSDARCSAARCTGDDVRSACPLNYSAVTD